MTTAARDVVQPDGVRPIPPLRDGDHLTRYEALSCVDGVYQSEVFPGLWLDAAAAVRGDMVRVLDVLQHGLSSPDHNAFVAGLSNLPSGRNP